MNWRTDTSRIEVYTETRKKRIFVGSLAFDSKSNLYTFDYDRKYLLSRNAIPLGPELPLKKPRHTSKKGELFPSFEDRIPSRQNSAYEEYCISQGISPKEKNKLVLLSTIGRRGPATFVFEPIHEDDLTLEALKGFRKSLKLSLREVATAFELPLLTLNRIETGKSHDRNTMRVLQLYIQFPEAGLWRVKLSQRKLHQDTVKKFLDYYEAKIAEAKVQPKLRPII